MGLKREKSHRLKSPRGTIAMNKLPLSLKPPREFIARLAKKSINIFFIVKISKKKI
jgi:hypothetical protein